MFYTSLLPQQFDLKSRVGECLLLPLAAHSLSTKKLELFGIFISMFQTKDVQGYGSKVLKAGFKVSGGSRYFCSEVSILCQH